MLNCGIEYRVGGRRESADEWAKAMEREVLEAGLNAIRSKVEALRCPDHQQSPQLNGQTPDGSDVSFSYSCCCEKLKEAVEQAFK